MILPLPLEGQAPLPVPPTRLLGRDQDCLALGALLADPHIRLVTLTGPGGVGKTHLSLEVAATVAPLFPDGIVFVSLASISDPGLVLSAIAQSLGLHDVPGQEHGGVLRDAIHGRAMLIVLDNLEQIVEAGPDIGQLLLTVQGPKVLATSRSPLRLRIEREYPVRPLPLPHPVDSSPVDTSASNPSIALFVERAQAVRPSFKLTDSNVSAVVELCRRLDGLPLAIELAAAMMRVMSPQAMMHRMEHRLHLLIAGAADLPPRQRTLRDAIAWSHDLLSDEEQTVFRRMAVFAGGATLDAIGAVMKPIDEAEGASSSVPGDRLLSIVSSLVTKSLLVQMEDGETPAHMIDEPRFRMLATIQEYAAELLDQRQELESVHKMHLDWVLGFAEQAEPELTGPNQLQWLLRLDAEHDNIRAALTWAMDNCHERGMHLASLLWRYWATHGLLIEGHTWLRRFLEIPTHEATHIGAKAYSSLGNLSLDLGDYVAASEAYHSALLAWEELGDQRGIADALNGQGLVDWYRGDYESARDRHEKSLELRQRIGDLQGQANSLTNLGNATKDAGDPHTARELHQQALSLRQSLGHRVGIGYSYLNLGDVARRLGEITEAHAMFARSLETFVAAGDTLGVGYAHQGLGLVHMLSGNPQQAGRHFVEALEIRLALGDRRGVVESLEGIASVATSLSRIAVATTLFGAAHMHRDQIGAPMPYPDRLLYEPIVYNLRCDTAGSAFSTNWASGERLSLQEAAEVALKVLRDTPAAQPAPHGVLSGREVEVLQLVATGLTNGQVADRLFLSRRTVDAHLRRIYDKLELSSRADAIRYAIENGLT